MRLVGGGRDITIPGANQKVEVILSLERKDLSGQSSDSSFANSGAKPHKVQVSTQIAMEDKNDLRRLAEVARACDAHDEPIIYEVDDDLCDAHKIRQVIFCGQLKSTEADGVRAWAVTFELQEFQSVAERREERAVGNAAEIAPAADGEVAIGTVDPAKVNQIIKATK